MSEKLGNEDNINKVRQMMAAAEANNTGLGNKLTSGAVIDFTSEEGNHYTGTIIFRRPGMKDLMRMGGIKSEFLRQAGVRDISLVDNTVKFMAHVMATLSVVIEKCPAWLLDSKGNIDLGSVHESDLLYHIFSEYEEWENSFRKPVQGTGAGDSGTAESTEAVAASEVLRESAAD